MLVRKFFLLILYTSLSYTAVAQTCQNILKSSKAKHDPAIYNELKKVGSFGFEAHVYEAHQRVQELLKKYPPENHILVGWGLTTTLEAAVLKHILKDKFEEYYWPVPINLNHAEIKRIDYDVQERVAMTFIPPFLKESGKQLVITRNLFGSGQLHENTVTLVHHWGENGINNVVFDLNMENGMTDLVSSLNKAWKRDFLQLGDDSFGYSIEAVKAFYDLKPGKKIQTSPDALKQFSVVIKSLPKGSYNTGARNTYDISRTLGMFFDFSMTEVINDEDFSPVLNKDFNLLVNEVSLALDSEFEIDDPYFEKRVYSREEISQLDLNKKIRVFLFKLYEADDTEYLVSSIMENIKKASNYDYFNSISPLAGQLLDSFNHKNIDQLLELLGRHSLVWERFNPLFYSINRLAYDPKMTQYLTKPVFDVLLSLLGRHLNTLQSIPLDLINSLFSEDELTESIAALQSESLSSYQIALLNIYLKWVPHIVQSENVATIQKKILNLLKKYMAKSFDSDNELLTVIGAIQNIDLPQYQSLIKKLFRKNRKFVQNFVYKDFRGLTDFCLRTSVFDCSSIGFSALSYIEKDESDFLWRSYIDFSTFNPSVQKIVLEKLQTKGSLFQKIPYLKALSDSGFTKESDDFFDQLTLKLMTSLYIAPKAFLSLFDEATQTFLYNFDYDSIRKLKAFLDTPEITATLKSNFSSSDIRHINQILAIQ